MVEQSCDNIPDIVEIPDLKETLHIVEGWNLETLTVGSKKNSKAQQWRKW